MSEWNYVCDTTQVQENHPFCTELDDGTQVVIFKIDDQFYAIENICTHDGGELYGGCVEGDHVVCPRHGAHFSIKTGEALSPPAYEPVATFEIKIVDQKIEIKDTRFD